MQTALQLRWHNVDPSDAVAAHVREEVARLERFWDRITGCAVTVEAPSRHHRHSGAQYRVRIELSVPRGKLVVGRAPPKTWTHGDLYLTLKAAFREAQRQLEDHVRRLDARVKTHAPPALATVARILPEEGYGFLRTPDGREIYFHEHSVVGGGFRRLVVGSEVRFVESAGDEGPQASTVKLVHPRRRSQVGSGARLDVLPRPDPRSTPLHVIIERRRSRREFGRRELTVAEIGALLWAGQGITSTEGGRAAPSAGALYPITLSVIGARGVWRYVPEEHALSPSEAGDRRAQLAAAALSQEYVAEAPATIAVTARTAVLAAQYGERAERYCALEAGHVAQNVLLMATGLGLAAVPVAAFDDEAVLGVLGLGAGHLPLYLLPVGAPLDGGG
jgi:SagB-type dehydrogenase family enzyme